MEPIYKENNAIVTALIDELKAAGEGRDRLPFSFACRILVVHVLHNLGFQEISYKRLFKIAAVRSKEIQ